ncbi:hypothetical protein D5039_21515 [Verminephrobacter aporrectodeae subsp. tuberculatae]|uniref:Uncharacterized protein n=1 Tax=Verminephrobacter aporrectodeae subsp. tuberculatae TaxID=1110392 RepID=A0ABT3L0M3_9BURK|nr:hypothetical protein [Verminephrobacter aporrectodeae]MCW5323630.1 hypothetical protein [Verminephrobacter aporrectodeae subsp. tuberculatae]
MLEKHIDNIEEKFLKLNVQKFLRGQSKEKIMQNFSHYAVLFDLDDFGGEWTRLVGFETDRAFDEFSDYMMDVMDDENNGYTGFVVVTPERAEEIKSMMIEAGIELDWHSIDGFDEADDADDYKQITIGGGSALDEGDLEPRWRFSAPGWNEQKV